MYETWNPTPPPPKTVLQSKLGPPEAQLLARTTNLLGLGFQRLQVVCDILQFFFQVAALPA